MFCVHIMLQCAMNEAVLERVRSEVQRRRLTHEQLADHLGLSRPQVSRMLSGRSGRVPEGWAHLLDLLGLELVAKRTRRGYGEES